ncbi:MAG: tRNA preQ1(34) S-adenosylmethionine ribosyltransferase-isomerase QueA [Alcaligenaceae bacterium]|nr:tRNA preQ1(34) S-adenosylmethionine ribosyltransferase-isomerase QueA [Alcaligenaceae bacterium]
MYQINNTLSVADFDYDLPEALIAQTPSKNRGESRLLHIDSQNRLHDLVFTDIASLLKPNDLLVFNNTKVIKARLHGQKSTGGKIEALIERITEPTRALAHVKSSKSPKAGTRLVFENAIEAEVLGRSGELFDIQFPGNVLELLDQYGSTPLPPYIQHAAEEADDLRYQTVYAREPGAVAAPTAGLHFDETQLQTLKKNGIDCAFVTLHVGAGTFQPVRAEQIKDHIMHAEWYTVSQEVVNAILQTRAKGGRVIAVGTTSVRALESAAQQAGCVEQQKCPLAHSADTQLFITPGYEFQVIDGLITNFHLPQSTLLMLVSALAGLDTMRQAYQHAIERQYRFFSYGDAMFIEPRP